LIDVSLSISPIRDRNGMVIGASKLARDITDRKQLQEKQVLLLHEMNHRVKNLFTLAGTIVALCSRQATTPQELSTAVQQRLATLAAAHQLTLLNSETAPTSVASVTTLSALILAIVAPYQDEKNTRVEVVGSDLPILSSSLTSIALLLHEFTSNSVKYGALSSCTGRVMIELSTSGEEVKVIWAESGGPAIDREPAAYGFGSHLETLISRSLGVEIRRQWLPEGLKLELTGPKSNFAHENPGE
jgi:two-component sensor histidine kinase